MSTIRDRNVIDITVVSGNRFILMIVDDMEWTFENRQEHCSMLQDKINDYLGYIVSGQAEEARPGLRPVIRVVAQHAYSRYCLDFLERVKAFIRRKDDICDLEWTHEGEGPFEDGFSDGFVFDADKVYPRLKKNWAKDPLKEIALMAPGADAPDYPDQMILIRVMDSFIGMLVQDIGNALTYLTYDMLPEGVTVDELQARAFDNLVRDISYRTCESKEPGIYGILAGGDFEAESLCLHDIWRQLADTLDDDLVICVPTKDIVFYTKASEKKLVARMKEMARETYARNEVESPYLLFCKDVFVYARSETGDGSLSPVSTI